MKNIKKVLLTLLSLCVCVCIGIISGMLINEKFNKPADVPFEMVNIQSMPDANGIIERIKVKDVLVDSVSGKSELVTMSAELTQQLQMDQSYNNWDIFKKTQDIIYHGTCKYSTDLGNFTYDDIYFHPNEKTIDITVPKPVINSLEINENETYINNTENGLLRFGEIKLTAFDENEIRKTVKDRMLTEAESSEYIETAEEKTVEAVSELFNAYLTAAGFTGYKINVLFK